MVLETGVEPVYLAWKAGTLADVLHPQRMGALRKILLEKIGTLKKGEKIFSLFPVLLYQKIFKKSTHFLMNQRRYS